MINELCVNPNCGNSIVDPGEQCDDSNLVNGDGCSIKCMNENFCGNGFLSIGESCDDKNSVQNDGCDQCLTETGFLCLGEPSICGPICGDGLVKGNEACDDNNNVPSDGCSELCLLEQDYICNQSPSVC